MGRPQWDRGQIKAMLNNETYAGTRYFNRITRAPEASREGKQVIHGRWVYRDRAEWIPVKVPAIVSRELFEIVHERLRVHEERYCRPVTHYLLQGLVQFGVCGSRCSSSRGYHKVVRPSGRVCACITGLRTAAIGAPERTCTIGPGSSGAAIPRSAPIFSKARCSS
jgi:hypothetical protein